MQFIDEARIYLKAGNGGNGAVSFHREKFIERGGPDGGDGGKGGSIIFRSNSHINTLINYRYKRHFKAENGEGGKGSNRTGKSRPPLILEVPVGTQIFSEEGDLLLHDFTDDNQEFEILSGERGGLGNTHFKSSVNRSPRQNTKGGIGQELDVHLKLKILSDAGLIGFPNSGKSTFLAATTRANPKIANYEFTTLKPGLGVVYVSDEEFVLADIPGLIKGASGGHGLGDRFLKHIERCKVLIHLIDATVEDVSKSYLTIRHELDSYSPLLKDKLEIICLNKIEMLENDEIVAKQKIIEKLSGNKVYNISTIAKIGLDSVTKKVLESLGKDEE